MTPPLWARPDFAPVCGVVGLSGSGRMRPPGFLGLMADLVIPILCSPGAQGKELGVERT